jgi:hypothetical protein
VHFSDHADRIRMNSSGARKVAAMLCEKAKDLDRLAREGKAR